MAKKRTAFDAELLLPLEHRPGYSLHAQLEDRLRSAIREGRLRSGARLPASRSLARDLGLSRGVVVDVYTQLAAEGYLEARSGSSTRVAGAVQPARLAAAPAALASGVRVDFRPGIPDVSLFPRTVWAAALRRAVLDAPAAALGYGQQQGDATLRAEVASYLSRVRGVAAEPSSVVICSGFAQALNLLCFIVREQGGATIAVEDPSHPEHHTIVTRAGLRALPIPVDEEGIDVDVLARSGAQAVVVTPAHQFPTGVVLSPSRRAALVNWARVHNGLILEDDYDAEYRYDRAPIGAVQGLAPERVLHASSLSKMLAPALRLGWLVAPEQLVDRLAAAKFYADLGTPTIDQRAFAQFIAAGELDRHLRRARAAYRTRRDHLVSALARHIPSVKVHGIAAGLHIVAELPTTLDERTVVATAREHGVGVYGLSTYYALPAPRSGLVMGYAALPESIIEAGIAALATALPRSHGD